MPLGNFQNSTSVQQQRTAGLLCMARVPQALIAEMQWSPFPDVIKKDILVVCGSFSLLFLSY